jgi:hypothetical protein
MRAPDEIQSDSTNPSNQNASRFKTYFNYPPLYNHNSNTCVANRKSSESNADFDIIANCNRINNKHNNNNNKPKQQLENTSNCFQYFSSTIFNNNSCNNSNNSSNKSTVHQNECMQPNIAIHQQNDTKHAVNMSIVRNQQQKSDDSVVNDIGELSSFLADNNANNSDLFSKKLKTLTDKFKSRNSLTNNKPDSTQGLKTFSASFSYDPQSMQSGDNIPDTEKKSSFDNMSKVNILTPGVFKDLKTKSLKTKKSQSIPSKYSKFLKNRNSSTVKEGFNLRKLADRLTKSALNIKDSFAQTKSTVIEGNSMFYQDLIYLNPSDADANGNNADACSKSYSVSSSEYSINTDEHGDFQNFSEKSSIDSNDHVINEGVSTDTLSKSITDPWTDDEKTTDDEYNTYLNYADKDLESNEDDDDDDDSIERISDMVKTLCNV